MGRFEPGKSGNPGGRPPRRPGDLTSLRATIAEAAPAIIKALVEAASKGDVAAARVLLERTVPIYRPEHLPVDVTVTGATAAQRANEIVSLALTGQIAPDVARLLVDTLSTAANASALDEMKRQLDELQFGNLA